MNIYIYDLSLYFFQPVLQVTLHSVCDEFALIGSRVAAHLSHLGTIRFAIRSHYGKMRRQTPWRKNTISAVAVPHNILSHTCVRYDETYPI